MPARGLFQDGISHSSHSFSSCLAEETAKNGGGQDHILSRMVSLCTLLPPLKAGRRLWREAESLLDLFVPHRIHHPLLFTITCLIGLLMTGGQS